MENLNCSKCFKVIPQHIQVIDIFYLYVNGHHCHVAVLKATLASYHRDEYVLKKSGWFI